MAIGNCITNDFVKMALDRAFNDDGATTYTAPANFRVGTGTTTPAISDTSIETQAPITATAVDDCDTADWVDDAEMTTSLNSTTYKEGDGALNLIKDAGAAAVCSCDKATTNVDFTSHELSVWLYIKDATALGKLAAATCLSIRFGSAAGAYYEWEYDKADIAVGWNLLDNMTSANADNTVGAPDIANCDYSYIELEATGAAIVWVAGDFIMDDWKIIDSADYYKSFEAGYPTENSTTKMATIRTRLASTEANGYLLTEHTLENSDGTPLTLTHSVFTSYSKGDTDELIFVEKIHFSNED